MKRVLKQTLLVIAVLIGLSLMPAFTNHVYALEKNIHNGNQGTKGAAHGGPCKERTGFLLSVTYADSENGTPTPMF